MKKITPFENGVNDFSTIIEKSYRVPANAKTDGGLCRTRTHDQSVMSAPL